MTDIGCPECGQIVEVANEANGIPSQLTCGHCNRVFSLSDGRDQMGETAVLEKEKPHRGAMLDIALVGHLRVSGSMSLEAPSALRPGKTIVGREDSDIIASDSTLSAQHFEIDSSDNQFMIQDLGSTNGTRVNGEPLSAAVALQNGDRIEAGKTTFVFRTLQTIPWSQSE